MDSREFKEPGATKPGPKKPPRTRGAARWHERSRPDYGAAGMRCSFLSSSALMTLEQTSAFLTFSVVGAITPGPSKIMATGSLVGLTRGLPCVLGAALGMSSLFFCAGLGLAQLLLLYRLTLTIMNLIGAVFLFRLAWKIETADVAQVKGDAKAVGFLQATAFQWMNPKGWMVGMSGIAAYSGASPGSVFGLAATFAVLFFVAAFPCGLAWLMAGALVQKLLQDARIARAFNIVMANHTCRLCRDNIGVSRRQQPYSVAASTRAGASAEAASPSPSARRGRRGRLLALRRRGWRSRCWPPSSSMETSAGMPSISG